jgi:hypothetical protein
MILLLLWLTFVFVTTSFTPIGLIAAVAKWQRREPFALLFITKSKPDLRLLLSSRPGVGLSQALSWFPQVPATHTGYTIPHTLLSISADALFATQPIIHRDSSVGKATRQKLSGLFSNSGGEAGVCSLERPYWRLWGPTSVLSNGYRGSFVTPRQKLTTHFKLGPTLSISGTKLQLRLHIFMLCTATSVHFVTYHSLLYLFVYLEVLFNKTGLNKWKWIFNHL